MQKLYGPQHIDPVKAMLSAGESKTTICAVFGWQPWTLTRFLTRHLADFVPDGDRREYNGYYVYRDGRVWSCKKRQFLLGEIDKDGYLVYGGLREQGLESKAHRLVLKTFVREPLPHEVTRHLDGNPGNNDLGNLAWGTEAENQQDRIKHGRHHWFENYDYQH